MGWGRVFQAAAGAKCDRLRLGRVLREAAGAPPLSQYIASRGAGAWATQNISPPLLSGTYSGGAYQLFSQDLSRAILANGWRCRDRHPRMRCPEPAHSAGRSARLPGLYLREGDIHTPLVTTADADALAIAPEAFQLSLEGAGPDLRQIVIAFGGNLYEWSDGGPLVPVNVLPGATDPSPGASLAAPAGAVSADGSRVYWVGADGSATCARTGR